MIESFAPADQGNLLDELRDSNPLLFSNHMERQDIDIKRITELSDES